MNRVSAEPIVPDYFLGLDFGQSQDFTAVAILERQRKPSRRPSSPDTNPAKTQKDRMEFHYTLRYLKRWKLKTAYPEIVAEVGQLVQTPPLEYPSLAADQTGVGVAIVDMLRHANVNARLSPIVITGGHDISFVDGAHHVPKKELVSTIQLLLQTQRLKFAANMPETPTLVKELLNFKVKITISANETFEAWRERDHDDLVLAVAMAAWMGEGGQANFEYPIVLDEQTRPNFDHSIFGSAGRRRF